MHMTHVDALLLGLLQGLAEFLPISSSGHLALAQHFLHLPDLDQLLPFDVLLHVATLTAVVAFYRQDLAQLLAAWGRSLPRVLREGRSALSDDVDAKLTWLVLLTMVPTGLLVKGLRPIDRYVGEHLRLIALLLLVAGTLNWFSDQMVRRRPHGKGAAEMTALDALWIGFAQGLAALFHGTSRSGSTIFTSLRCGLSPELAPRFSFIMLIPSVLAAALLEVPKLRHSAAVPLDCMVIAFIVATVVGYFAVGLTVKLVKQERMRYFAYYCWTVGLLAFGALSVGR